MVSPDRPAHGPTRFAYGVEHADCNKTGLREIGDRVREVNRFGTAEFVTGTRIRYIGDGLFPHRIAFRVECADLCALHTSADTAIGAVPDCDAVDRLFGPEIDFPPRFVCDCGMRNGLADEVFAVGVAIDGELSGAIVRGADLRCNALGCDVLAAAEYLHFCEHQIGVLFRLRNANESCNGHGRLRRDETGRDASHDEVPSAVARSTTGKLLVRKRNQADAR